MATRTGGTGADVFDAVALGEADQINSYFGQSGDDTLIGGALRDSLVGGEGSDRLFGDDGADTLVDRGKVGDDRLDGGTGDDTIESRYGNDTLIGGAGHDTITFGFGSMLIDGGTGDDTFIAIGSGPASSTITGGAGDDVLVAGASADAFNGGQGEDLVDYSATRLGVSINFQTGATGGGAAGDSFRFVEDVIGTAAADVIIGDGAYNVLFGGGGNDTLGGGYGADYLDGGDGLDVADLGAGGSTGVVANLATGSYVGGGADGDTIVNIEGLAGGDFADSLTGDANANVLIGRGGVDTLDGGAGADTMIGGAGGDVYRVDDGADVIVEDASGGVDRVAATIDYSLADLASVENLTLIGPGALAGTGNELANVITGNEFDNVLRGGGGEDTLVGELGDDTYYIDSAGDRIAEASDPGSLDQVFSSVSVNMEVLLTSGAVERITLTGEADIDFVSSRIFTGEAIGNAGDNRFVLRNEGTFTGGDGADTFYFSDSLNTGRDAATVTDFTTGEDIVELNGTKYSLATGPLDPNVFALNRAADTNDRVIYKQDVGELYIDKDGSGSRFGLQLIGFFEPGLELRADDFVVV